MELVIDTYINATPQPKGSVSAFVVNDRAIITHSGKSKQFEKQIINAFADYDNEPIDAPCSVEAIFYIDRPKTVKRKYPNTVPDLDKYARALLDALEKVNVLKNDSRVVNLYVRKRYVDEEHPETGVHLTIIDLTNE